MRLLLPIFALAVSFQAEAGWRWRDADPFNRNSAIRRAARNADPSAALGRLKTRALHRMANVVATSDSFRDKAKRDGWTQTKCRAVGAGIAGPIIAIKGAAICASMTAAEPISAATCTTALTVGAGAITEIACTQLCHDHHLRDC